MTAVHEEVPATTVGTTLTLAPKVVGLDLSLSCTGLAGNGWTDVIKTKARRKHDPVVDFQHRRMRHILDTLDTYLSGVQLAVIEGLALSPGMDADRQLAHLNWSVRDRLWRRGIPYALVGPTVLKRYAVGKGRRDVKVGDAKAATMQVVRDWYPDFNGDDNAADAAVLHAMGCDWLGYPVVRVPAANRAALSSVVWPTVEMLTVAA